MTVLVTTHYLEEADRCDRLLILDQGKKVALGNPDQLKSGNGRGSTAHSGEKSRGSGGENR